MKYCSLSKANLMSFELPKKERLKNGELLIIRHAEPADAKAIIGYVKTVGDETTFLTFEGWEFTKTEEEEMAIISAHRDAPNKLFIVALIDGKVVGLLNVSASHKKRLQHKGEFGISVLKAHWKKGIANLCLTATE